MNMKSYPYPNRPIVNMGSGSDDDDYDDLPRKRRRKSKRAKKADRTPATLGNADSLTQPGAAISLLKELRSQEEHDESRYRAKFRRRLTETYKVALVAAESVDIWQEICDHPEWRGFKQAPKHDDQKDALRYVVRLFVGFDGLAATKKASKYYVSLKPWFERRAPASEVREALKREGGIENLARNASDDRTTGDEIAELQSLSGVAMQLVGSKANLIRGYPPGTRLRLLIEVKESPATHVRCRVRSVKIKESTASSSRTQENDQ